MKIIVTGGAGFIASHITDAYIKAGHSVAVIDNLLTGSRKNVHPKARFYKADIVDRAAMDRIFKKERPEIVNHHAALIAVTESVHDPLPTLQTNTLGTANLLLAFGAHGAGKHKKFIYASTGGAMYGSPKHTLVSEKAPEHPLSPYGLSKKLSEETIKFYAGEFGFDYFIFRYANVYGPRQHTSGEAGIVPIFVNLIRRGATPTIFGDGTKARDYVYVEDVARANTLAIRKGKNETVNIGTGTMVSDTAMFNAIARALGFTQKPIYAAYRPGEVYRIALDARKAKHILGWSPKMPFAAGIKHAVAGV